MEFKNQDPMYEVETGLKNLNVSVPNISRPLQITGIDPVPLMVMDLLQKWTFDQTKQFTPSTTDAITLEFDVWTRAEQIFPQLSKLYNLLRADLQISLRLTSHPQHVGALCVVLYQTPSTGGYAFLPEIPDNSDQPDVYFEYPNRIIQFGTNDTVEITVPWNSAFQMLPANRKFNQAIVKVHVLDALKVATGVKSTAVLQVYVRLVNVQLAAYNNNL